MPDDLFGDVVSRPAAARPRRASLVITSVVAHVVAIAAVLVVSLVATDTLPMPRLTLAYYGPPGRVIDVTLPPPLRLRAAGVNNRVIANPAAAPLDAPSGIPPESGLERGTTLGAEGGTVVGLVRESGIGNGIGLPEAPPPVPATPTAPIRLHSGIRPPEKILNVPPAYPAIARSARVQGLVILEATIDERGNVVAATVLRSIQLLDAAALDAVRQWKFTPALLNGVPIPVVMTVTANFRLQ